MSLVEPLLPKEDVKDQKLEKRFNDPLANLEKSIEELSVEFESYELDGASDVEFRDSDSVHEKEFYGKRWNRWDIKCTATFKNKLIIGRIDGVIKIYDLDTKEEMVLKGHSNAVNCLQVSSNQKYLVSGSRDKAIIIWNLETYQQLRVFKTDNEVFCLVVTSGMELFSGSLSENLIRKWDFSDENLASSTLTGHEGGITCMKSTKNNYFLITGSMDRSLRIWSIQNSQVLQVFTNHFKAIYQFLITEDDKYMISVSKKRDVFTWDINKRQMIDQLDVYNPNLFEFNNKNECILHSCDNQAKIYHMKDTRTKNLEVYDVSAITCSGKNDLGYIGLNNQTAKVIDLKEQKFLTDLKGFDCKIIKMLLVGDHDEYLASIMENGKIKIHQIYKEKAEEDFIIKKEVDINNIRLSKDGKYLIYFGSNSLTIWNLLEKKVAFSKKLTLYGGVKFSYDYKYFAFNDSYIIYVYSFQDMEEVAKFDMEAPNRFFCLAISQDNQFIAAGNSDGSIAIFNIEKKCKTSTLEGEKLPVEFLEITKSNEYLVSIARKKNLGFWSLSEKKIIKSFQMDQNIKFLSLNNEKSYAVVVLQFQIEVWDFQKQIKQSIIKAPEDKRRHSFVEISQDGEYLLFPQDKGAIIWSFEHFKEVESISNYPVKSFDITKDNKYILVVDDEERYVKLWSYEEKRFISKIYFEGLGMNYAKFIGDGKAIITYNNQQFRIHNIEKYIDCSRSETYLYFISGLQDKITKYKFFKWLKSPLDNQWDNLFLNIVVNPIGYNLLHHFCIYDKVDLLSNALKNGGEIFRDNQNMSPLSYALIRNSRRCIDEILNYVINLEDDTKIYYCIHQLRDDIPMLFNAKTLLMVPFLEVLFRRRADKDHIGFYEVNEELPMSIFSPVSKIYTSAFTGEIDIEKNESAKQNEKLIQFWGSPWGYNYAAGSEESLLLLKKIDESENQDIFLTLLVQSIIREKWEYLWPSIITISIIYWLNLIVMIWYIFDPNNYILVSFIVLNGILALYEFLQFITKPKDYVSEIWNLVDCFRMSLSIMWAVLQFYDENIEWLSFAVVFFNFFRGLTYFRAFDFTRFYVRLILMGLTDSFAFLIIFLYSTLAFGVLYASLDTTLSFSDMWAMAYELNMGNFDNGGFTFLQYSCFTLATLINVVMMLNLLVSTLGDTFDRFQMITDSLDTKEMLQLVLEFESIMFWARTEQAKLRNKGKLIYLQRCDIFQDSDVPDKWQGKIKEISLKIDEVKDDVLGNKKSLGEELKKLDANIKGEFEKNNKSHEKTENSMNRKIEDMESKINGKVADLETKMNRKIEGLESKINDMIEFIKTKLDT